MNEKDLPELDLEDILKEFGDHPEEEAVEEIPQQTIREEVTGDTIRLDQIQKAVASAARQAAPITEDTQVLPDLSEDAWPAEYDEELEKYAPIAFKPKSRLQYLRAKLVAGPEKRYYALSEQGSGKLQAGMLLNFLIFLVATGSTVLYGLQMVPPERLKLLVFIQLLCMLLAALFGCYRLLEGLGDIFRLRFTPNTLLAFTFIICCIDGGLCLQEQRISCSAVFCLQMLLAQAGAHQRRSRELSQMDTLRRATELEALVCREDYHNGKPGFVTATGEPECFMDSYAVPSAPEQVLSWYCLGALLISLGLGGWAAATQSLSAGAQACAGALLLSLPATAFITISRPEALLQKRLSKLGTVLCGWQGIRATGKKCVQPVSHEDLFPEGNVKLNGVKYYGTFSPDTVVCFAASLMAENGGSLEPLLRQLLAGRNGEIRPVLDFGSFEGGVSGVIDGTPVSLGTPDFTQQLGVDLAGAKLPLGVCLCIDGQMAGFFAVAYSRSKSANAGLRTLCSYRNLEPVLISRDPMLSRAFLSQHFRGNITRLQMPDGDIRRQLQEKLPQEDATVVALMTKPGLAPKAFALTGAQALRTAWKLGVGIHMAGGILGLVVAGLLVYFGGLQLLTPVNLLLYGIIWMLPGFLVTQWTRVI